MLCEDVIKTKKKENNFNMLFDTLLTNPNIQRNTLVWHPHEKALYSHRTNKIT